MTSTEKSIFYQEIPKMMQHFPHMYILNQQQEQMQRNHEQQQKASSMMSPEMNNFINRLETINKLVEQRNVNSWTSQERESFYDNFSSNPLLEKIDSLSIVGTGMEAVSNLLSKFTDLNDEDMTDLLTIQAVVIEDMKVKGLLAQKFQKTQEIFLKAAKENNELEMGSSNNKIVRLLATLGQLTMAIVNSGRGQTNMDHNHGSHDHTHGHGHTHDEHCSHGNVQKAPDVSTGKADKMVR